MVAHSLGRPHDAFINLRRSLHMPVTFGTTSFGFRYALAEESRAPSLTSLVGEVAALGLQAFQICENARPLQLHSGAWRDVIQAARDHNVELHVGCMALDVGVLARYMELAAAIPNPTLRIVLEEPGGAPPERRQIEEFLAAAAPRLQAAGVSLAIENHFDIPCRTLVEAVARYPASLFGFCIDTANSLRNWESPEQVFELLESRAVQFHLKDFKLVGTNVGFSVGGAPLGEGALDLAACRNRICARRESPRVFLENWVPSTGDRTRDITADAEWLARSLACAQAVFAANRS
jgi:3-oxoisoapionate decarboxylase